LAAHLNHLQDTPVNRLTGVDTHAREFFAGQKRRRKHEMHYMLIRNLCGVLDAVVYRYAYALANRTCMP